MYRLNFHCAVCLTFVYHEIIRTNNSCNSINNLILLGFNFQWEIFRGCTFNQQCSEAIYIYKSQNLRRNISTSRLKILQTISNAKMNHAYLNRKQASQNLGLKKIKLNRQASKKLPKIGVERVKNGSDCAENRVM